MIPKGCALYKLCLHSSEHEPATTTHHSTEEPDKRVSRRCKLEGMCHVITCTPSSTMGRVNLCLRKPDLIMASHPGRRGALTRGGAVILTLHLGLGAELGSFCADPLSYMPFLA